MTFFDALCKNRDRHIICGDFNARHTTLGDSQDTQSGQLLLDIILNNELIVTNDTYPTYFSDATLTDSILDHILITKSISHLFTDILIDDTDLGSDHNVITVWFGLKSMTDDKRDTTIKLYNKQDWKTINEQLIQRYKNVDLTHATSQLNAIDTKVDSLTELIQDIYNDLPEQNINRDRPTLPLTIQNILRDKRQARIHWKRTKNKHFKTEYNNLNKRAKLLIKQHKQQNWDNYCNDMELNGQKDSWKKIGSVVNKRTKSFDYPTLKTTDSDGTVLKHVTTTDKLTAFYESLKPTFEDNTDPPYFDNQHKSYIDRYVNDNADIFNCTKHDTSHTDEPITVSSAHVTLLIKALNPKKAAGPDKINHRLIKLLEGSLSTILSEIFTLSLRAGYIPKAWKQASVLVIKKPNKIASDPGNYRPISLLNCLGKLLETIVTSQLKSWAESNHKINIEQSGFRAKRSTQDQLFRLTQQIAQGLNRRQTTSAIFLDIEKAFDRVWHNGLRYKLAQLDTPPHLLKWVSNFLNNRKMQITINNKHSKTISVKYGVPQGSPLSPLLFLLYVADCPIKSMTRCSGTQFADDLSICTTSRSVNLNIKNLQAALYILSEWCNKWRIRLSQNKSKLIHFNRHRNATNLTVTINKQPISVCKEAKFLGITFDRRLTFNSHFKKQRQAAIGRLIKLRSLTSQKVGPSDTTMLRLYKCYVRSLFEYGNSATNIASLTTFKLWESIQTKFAHQILNIPSYISTINVNKFSNLLSVRNRNRLLSSKWYHTSQTSTETKQFINSIIKTFPDFDKFATPYDFCHE